MQKCRFITFILLILTLASCSRSIVSDVTRYLTPPGKTAIEVTSLRPEL